MNRSQLTLLALVLLFGSFSFSSQAQVKEQVQIDSLLRKLSSAKQDTSKLLLLSKIGQYYIQLNQPTVAKKYIEQERILSDRISWLRGKAIVAFDEAYILHSQTNYTKALEGFKQARDLAVQAHDDKLTIQALGNMARCYYYLGQLDAAEKHQEEVVAGLKKMKSNRGLATENAMLGQIAFQKKNIPKAVAYFEEALAYAKLTKNDALIISCEMGIVSVALQSNKASVKLLEYCNDALTRLKGNENDPQYATVLQLTGQTYHRLSRINEAIDHYLLYVKQAEKKGDKMSLLSAYMTMGQIYAAASNNKKASEHFLRALELSEKINDPGNIYQIWVLTALEQTYGTMEEYDKMLLYDKRLLALPIDTAKRIDHLNSVAWAYHKKKDHDLAYYYGNEGMQLAQKSKLTNAMLISTMGSIIRDAPDEVLLKYGIPLSQRNQKALDLLQRSMAMLVRDHGMGVVAEEHRELSLLNEKMHNYGDALTNFKRYIQIKDSLETIRQKTDVQKRVAQFEFAKKEDSLKYQQRLTSEKLARQTLLGNQQKQSLLINQQKLSLANRQQEVEHLGFLKTQADLQAEQNKRKANEQHLNVVKKEQALAQATVELQRADIRSKQYQSYFYLGGLAALIILSIFIGLNYRNQRLANAQISKANRELSEQREEITAQRDQLSETLNNLKSAQQQLIQTEKMASLGELTAGIAHEIQNPLNFVNNFSEVSGEMLVELEEEMDKGDIAEAKAISADLRQNVQKIHHHGKRADGIVKGMLEHSRSTSGQKQPTNINKLANEYLNLAYHGFCAKDESFSAQLVTEFADGLPMLNVIPQDIGRVLVNLFNNALYAVKEKKRAAGADYEPKVMVRTELKGGELRLTVKDNGPGIPDAIKDKIMQPFFTTKPTGQGTGLGLSLSYDIIVKGHGGKIAINNEVQEGAEFMISFPTEV